MCVAVAHPKPSRMPQNMKFKPNTCIALAILISIASAPTALAQQASYSAEFERPYGWDTTVAEQSYEPGSRDRYGNRVVINGLINGGTTLGQGLYTGWGQTDGASGMLGSGLAAGNQLNVVTNGSNNTIIIDSTQINTGDQTVIIGGE